MKFKKIICFIVLLLFTLTGIGYAADQTWNFTWKKSPIEDDLAGFTLYEFDELNGTPTGNTWDIPYVAGETTFAQDIVITLPDTSEGKRCYNLDAYDKSNNHTPERTVMVDVGEVGSNCFLFDTKPPTVPTEFKINVIIVVE